MAPPPAAAHTLPSNLRQLVELSRTEYRTCAVFLMQDRDTQRVYRLYDFTNTQLIPPDQAYCIAGTGNGAGERCCQDNGRVKLVRGWRGSPKTMVSNHLSATVQLPKSLILCRLWSLGRGRLPK